MDPKVLDFLTKERISALSINLSDGTPHTSAMVFAFTQEPLQIFFLTDKKSRKCEPLLEGLSAKASFVIGFSETDFVTLQIDGIIKLEDDRGRIEEMRKAYFEKYPDHKHYENESSCWLTLVPTWWRYTDFKPVPNYILTS